MPQRSRDSLGTWETRAHVILTAEVQRHAQEEATAPFSTQEDFRAQLYILKHVDNFVAGPKKKTVLPTLLVRLLYFLFRFHCICLLPLLKNERMCQNLMNFTSVRAD